ncbi:MAG: class fructose,6-bisphosphate aldolase [Herbinix sp.]|nr:class fructose,6-bisphosphate aldolase [Herbinix sp.]
MLIDLKQILAIGEERKCAIPAFNVYNLETAIGVYYAAMETGAPVIFQMYSRLFDDPSSRYFTPMILEMIASLPTPAAFHLDHGAGKPEVLRALRYGVSGVMIDASTHSLAENIAMTKEVVLMCKEVEVSVEGELGHIGSTKDSVMSEYTRVEEAVQYVKETGISALAIMVGTAHGHYKQAPVLDINRIKEIKEATQIPLVLHGGSGVPDEQIRMAIDAGIRKINFGTDVCCSFLDSVYEVSRDIIAVDLFMKEPIEAVKQFALAKINLLGVCKNV